MHDVYCGLNVTALLLHRHWTVVIVPVRISNRLWHHREGQTHDMLAG